MSEDPTTQAQQEPKAEQPSPSMEESWREVGKQFEVLGQGIARAWKAAVSTEQATEMKSGLESMVNDVAKAIRDAAESPEGQKVREETNRTVESLRTAGEQTVREVRPQVISALKQLNEELQKLVNKIEQG